MQLGARWAAGSPPHPSVPSSLHEAIAGQEAAHPDAESWTLTWLEGRPRCQLSDGVIVTIDAAGAVQVLDAPGGAGAFDPIGGPAHDDDDDDDDAWLS